MNTPYASRMITKGQRLQDFDDDGRNVVRLRRVVRELPRRIVQGMDDLLGWFALVGAHNIEHAIDSEERVIQPHGFLDAIRERKEHVARLKLDFGCGVICRLRVNAQRDARSGKRLPYIT